MASLLGALFVLLLSNGAYLAAFTTLSLFYFAIRTY